MKRALTTIILLIILILLVGGGLYYLRGRDSGTTFARAEKDSGKEISEYSAVFLTNGQVYFGKILGRSETEVDLRDIYYLQVDQKIQPNQQSSSGTDQQQQQPNVVLVKLGDELHGPNDRMRINRDQVIFTESLKENSKVVEAIQKYQDEQQ
jgi:hypothetical protein